MASNRRNNVRGYRRLNKHTKKILITIAKYGISLSILAYLFWQASHDEYFLALRDQPKNWVLLSAALVVCLLAVVSTFVRWFFLVRAIHIPLALPEALRLGFVGFMFNFLTLGVVGGDLVKAIFLARRRPGQRTEAVATIVIDRMIGLYALFVVATIAILSVDLSSIQTRNPAEFAAFRVLCWITIGATIVGTLGIITVALPTFGKSPLWEWLSNMPRVGEQVKRVTTALRIYRSKPALMAGVGIMSLLTHVLFVSSVFLIALGLPGEYVPSLAAHFIIVPIANVANTVPLPGGMGAYEYVLDFLYRAISPGALFGEHQGFVIALGYRFITVIVALIGAAYYLTGREEMSKLVKEAEHEMEDDAKTTG